MSGRAPICEAAATSTVYCCCYYYDEYDYYYSDYYYYLADLAGETPHGTTDNDEDQQVWTDRDGPRITMIV